MAQAGPRVLVVEDDETLREMLTMALRAEGYRVQAEPDGRRLDGLVRQTPPDLAVLDVRLPVGPDGLELARRLRGLTDAPILFLTAADRLEDRLGGFDAGGDDYLTKPFALAEALARARALLRRAGRLGTPSWQVADLVVDESARTVTRGGAHIELTRTEFDLLDTLGRHRGTVLSKSQLLSHVWGFEAYDPNLVEVHVSALRRKLEEHGTRMIHTVRGVGYVLRP